MIDRRYYSLSLLSWRARVIYSGFYPDSMKLLDLIIYTHWADDVYIKYAEGLTEDQFKETVPGVNKNLRQLLNHIYATYWGEYHLITDMDWSSEPDFSQITREEIISGIKEMNGKIVEYIKNTPLDTPIEFEDEGKQIKTNAEEIIFNFVTHSAYHRGQMALLLRYHGLESIKQTDYNPYLYEMSHK